MIKSKPKAKALESMKLKVKHGKGMEVKKSTTLTNDWKKGKNFHFSNQN